MQCGRFEECWMKKTGDNVYYSFFFKKKIQYKSKARRYASIHVHVNRKHFLRMNVGCRVTPTVSGALTGGWTRLTNIVVTRIGGELAPPCSVCTEYSTAALAPLLSALELVPRAEHSTCDPFPTTRTCIASVRTYGVHVLASAQRHAAAENTVSGPVQ